jgi:hypothetical protein
VNLFFFPSYALHNMSMSALQEEAELGEFFDFHNAVSDGGSMQTSGAFADPDHLSHVAERLAH